jgi:hypothetical protein
MFKIISLLILIVTDCLPQSIFERWHNTDVLIRDRKIPREAAIDSVRNFTRFALEEIRHLELETTKREDWAFPMKNFTVIKYRENGNDYRDEKFDYFQGGESKGHPAHDIFILDDDNNSIEDSTGEKVYAVAMVTGIILSTYGDWKIGDFLRSGNYVKLFDPESVAIFYYSHLDTVFVTPGSIVKKGDPIGYVGRTGRKAIKGRTHIHIAYYRIMDGYPRPEKIIDDLRRAELKTD